MAKIAWMITAFFVLFFMNIAFAAKKSDGDQNSNVPYHPMGGEGSLTPAECPTACKFRCSATSHKKPCLFYCNECCAKCLCVPSGTYGHKDECPCYRDWKTKKGGPKCP